MPSARARPHLRELTERYRNRKDPESLRAFAAERRRIAAEHRLSPWGCLPVLAQIPVWLALYHLLSDVAGGSPVGAVDAGLVASLGAATVLGVPLAERGYLGAGGIHLAVVAALAGHRGAAVLRHPEVRRRTQHRPGHRLRDDAPGPPADAGPVCCRAPGRGRGRAGGAARLLGRQLVVDPRAVRGHRSLVPHPGLTGSRPRRGQVRAARSG